MTEEMGEVGDLPDYAQQTISAKQERMRCITVLTRARVSPALTKADIEFLVDRLGLKMSDIEGISPYGC